MSNQLKWVIQLINSQIIHKKTSSRMYSGVKNDPIFKHIYLVQIIIHIEISKSVCHLEKYVANIMNLL